MNQTQVAKLLDDHSWIFSPFIRNILCRSRERMRCLKDFSRQFLVRKSQLHQEILKHMGLENFCVEPYFSSLRNNMRELVEVLAAVAAGVPQQHYGFYRLETLKFICCQHRHRHALVLDAHLIVSLLWAREELSVPLPPCHEDVPQEVARHCMIQARLLAYRTGVFGYS